MLSTLLLALVLQASPVPGAEALFDPATGYRMSHYRGVIHAPPPGVPRLDAAAAAALHDGGGSLFLDVTPATDAVRDDATGVWRLAEPHATIPGAHWFPEAGRGQPDMAIDAWFASGVRRLAAGRLDRPTVVFCLADCWMSWNAAWKLRRAGYRSVAWFADGADGWRDLGRSLAPAQPEPPVRASASPAGRGRG